MTLDVTQRIDKHSLILDPCPFFSVPDALPWDLYQNLVDQYPEDHMTKDGKTHFQARRYRQHEFQPGTITPLWAEFIAYHNSVEFKNRVLELFEPALDRYYKDYKSLWQQATVVPRHSTPSHAIAAVAMEVQFVLNGQQEQTVRTVHLDNSRELFAALLYMRKPQDHSQGGDIQIYKKLVDRPQFDRREVNPDQVTAVATVPYQANHMILFLNTVDSLHGVTPRIGANCVRRYINIDAHQDYKLFSI